MNILEEAKRVLSEESKAILNSIDYLDDNFLNSCKAIKEANKVVICGVGKSGLIGAKISATFSSVGIPSISLHPTDALHGDLGLIQYNDITILISKSGSTDELVLLFPYLKKRTKIISITSQKSSFLAKNSDYHLYIPVEKEACPVELAPTTSTTATLAMGDALAACVMKLNNFTEIDFANNHPLGQLGKNMTLSVGDVMHRGESIPLINKNATFKEALIEMTDKSLGCLCVTDSDRLVGIITDGDTRRALNRYNLISDIKIEDIMTANPITVNESTLIGRALSAMENRKSQINVLPVVDDNHKCVGVVRIHDLIKSRV